MLYHLSGYFSKLHLTYLVLAVYLFILWVQLFRSEKETFIAWHRSILIMVTGVWSALVYQHMSDKMMDYAIGAVIAAAFIYWLFFQSFKSGVLSKGGSVSLQDQTLEKVREAMEHQSVYSQPGMSL